MSVISLWENSITMGTNPEATGASDVIHQRANEQLPAEVRDALNALSFMEDFEHHERIQQWSRSSNSLAGAVDIKKFEVDVEEGQDTEDLMHVKTGGSVHGTDLDAQRELRLRLNKLYAAMESHGVAQGGKREHVKPVVHQQVVQPISAPRPQDSPAPGVDGGIPTQVDSDSIRRQDTDTRVLESLSNPGDMDQDNGYPGVPLKDQGFEEAA